MNVHRQTKERLSAKELPLEYCNCIAGGEEHIKALSATLPSTSCIDGFITCTCNCQLLQRGDVALS